MNKVHKIIMAAVLTLATAITLSCSSGGGGGDGDPIADHLTGTWTAADGEEITFSGSGFEVSQNSKAIIKGTYTATERSVSANITLAVNQLHGDFLNEMDEDDLGLFENNKWYNKSQVIAVFREYLRNAGATEAQIASVLDGIDFDAMFPTYSGTIDGNTMTVDGTTYTKNGGTSGGGMKWTAVADSKFGTPTSHTESAYDINAIAYGNNRFVAVGWMGKIAYSANGSTWTAVTNSPFDTSSDGTINTIAFGDGKFVASARRGKVATSTDGVNWTAVANSPFGSENINVIAYVNNKFFALGYNKMAYSTDGVNWTAVDLGSLFSGRQIDAIAYGDGRFVAGGGVGTMATSTDGSTWTVAEKPFGTTTYEIEAIAYGDGTFVAAGSISRMATSTDGLNWTAVTDRPFNVNTNSLNIEAIAYGNNKFVAVGSEGRIAASTDGTSWTGITANAFGYVENLSGIGQVTMHHNINAIAYGNGTWVAVGNRGRMAYSTGN